MTNEDLQQIQNLVNGSARVLILTRSNPSIDAMGSALAIYLAMTKMGKDAIVAMESAPLVEVANLVGIDRVKTSLEGKNLLLTYRPYSLGDFEKVSYLEDQGQAGVLSDSFKLTITPREGFMPDPKNFQFSFTGAAADLIYTVDVLDPAQLGTLYDQNLLSSVPIINIDNHDPNKDYGRFNLVEPEAASISEIVTFFLRAVNSQFDADIAGNLLQGIISATSNFQSERVAAATFEAAAICLRSGAKQQKTFGGVGQSPDQPVRTAQPQTPRPVGQQTPNIPTAPQTVRPAFDQSLSNKQTSHPQRPMRPQAGQPVVPNQQVPPSSQNQSGRPPQGGRNNGVPEDWTQPKAYRGTSTV